jgi:hypothetical protein
MWLTSVIVVVLHTNRRHQIIGLIPEHFQPIYDEFEDLVHNVIITPHMYEAIVPQNLHRFFYSLVRHMLS